ncbi:WecB/TagA/CpsF family glycosyltransferase [Marinobacterium rhizophilum]|uniref:WecB/TagA/CpsF family glycosyltransferase n=1 Tax=Marinobacterium rhizophilum TaxID=420402 RepID=A0ABY5HET4_9GAMM|nr:WecB/TagA/CpsF family glycosyltransferase [Marinobacterium rhizophilum]UTW10629.1 WecB/TagA/CpsF family glycosyltransferase [Marinobacterium rhizophilum]
MDSQLIGGIKIYAPNSRKDLIDFAFNHHSLLVAVNAEKILHATEQSRNIISRNVGYPDGIGAIMALNKKGVDNVVKIPGCELWLDIIRTRYKTKRFYLVGGKDEIIEQTVTQLRVEFPGIDIANYRNGYLNSATERQALIEDVAVKKPDVVFVAMGSPKQELLMEDMRSVHPAVYQGLGGSFDVYTGNVQRAPAWWVEHRLEWFYRLLQEPSRIKRQIHLVRFLFLLKLNRF